MSVRHILTYFYFLISGENRSFASYGPIDDMCAKMFYFSRFPLLLAVNTTHSVMSTGTIPSTGECDCVSVISYCVIFDLCVDLYRKIELFTHYT